MIWYLGAFILLFELILGFVLLYGGNRVKPEQAGEVLELLNWRIILYRKFIKTGDGDLWKLIVNQCDICVHFSRNCERCILAIKGHSGHAKCMTRTRILFSHRYGSDTDTLVRYAKARLRFLERRRKRLIDTYGELCE